jgi:aspartyl-tRNA(Asn)/glutamyl-tRNA(Gln) amidotransferase subunit B
MSTDSQLRVYTPTIGLEIHAELNTKTKMFCGCKNAPHESKPNLHVCPVCMAHPGTLPVVNRTAIEKVLDVGMALGSTLADYTEFDRKNYFYPDIPKGYQISQFAYPLVCGGSLNNIEITRIHLEEDTARSSHERASGSLVDYNRAGVPLMELVTEPVIHDAATAGNFGRELQLLLRELGVSDANMEKGEMRVEANISISPTATLGTKVEVKNLNSFKAVEAAIEYEIKRHTALLLRGEPVVQETRGWDDAKGITFSQRKKESSHDYRYFPDPDIPSFDTEAAGVKNISRTDDISAKIPSKIRLKYLNLGLTSKQADSLIVNPNIRTFFEHILTKNTALAKLGANYLTSDVLGLLESGALLNVYPTNSALESFTDLIIMLSEEKITSRVAKDLLTEVCEGRSARAMVSERNLEIATGTDVIDSIVREVIAEQPSVVADYKGGKASAIQFLVGQGMKKGKGAVDPGALRSALEKSLQV